MSDQADTNEIETDQNPVETEDERTTEQAEAKAEPELNESETATAAATNDNPKLILYNLNISPAVRCVKIVARLINLELEFRYV